MLLFIVPVQGKDKDKNKNNYYEIEVIATAYCDGNITSTGTTPKIGTISVDPAVIPYGTRLHVEGYGDGYAEDCGSDIVGYRIDVYHYDREWCKNWGRKRVRVRVYR